MAAVERAREVGLQGVVVACAGRSRTGPVVHCDVVRSYGDSLYGDQYWRGWLAECCD